MRAVRPPGTYVGCLVTVAPAGAAAPAGTALAARGAAFLGWLASPSSLNLFSTCSTASLHSSLILGRSASARSWFSWADSTAWTGSTNTQQEGGGEPGERGRWRGN